MRIGFFDSGLGGLLVMEHCLKAKPFHNYVFLGDTKYLPYGPRPLSEIIKYSFPCILFLLQEKECDLVIVACNTISVKAVGEFKIQFPQYKDRVIGIDIPTITYLTQESNDTLVLSTLQTKESKRYDPYVTKVVAMPGLVELVENGDREAALSMCKDVLSYNKNVESVLLGCTHYIWLADILSREYPDINFIRQDHIVENIIPASGQDHSSSEYYLSLQVDEYTKKYQHQFELVSIER